MKMSNLSFFLKKLKQNLWRLKNNHLMKIQVLSFKFNSYYLAIETKTHENLGYLFRSIYASHNVIKIIQRTNCVREKGLRKIAGVINFLVKSTHHQQTYFILLRIYSNYSQ